MGRWDFLADQKPLTLQAYVLDAVAAQLATDLTASPPPVQEWLDEAARQRFSAALARPGTPPADTLRVACELARLELLREIERIDRFWRGPEHEVLLPTPLERDSALFLTRFLVDTALDFQEFAQGKFRRSHLVQLVEKVEDRVVHGHRLRLIG